MDGDDAAVVDRNARAFLAPVLQGIEGQIGLLRHLQSVFVVNPK